MIRTVSVVTALLLTGASLPCRAADDDAAAWELIRSADEDLKRREIAELVDLDIELAERSDARAAEMRGAILKALAVSGKTPAIEYVRGVFESDVEQRDEAAYAISLFCLNHRRTPGDWQYLVRSLMVVEGPQAESVMTALLQFRERATKPVWIRQVILLGLTLEPAGMTTADSLLAHWSDREPDAGERTPQEQLAGWQAWFREQFPEEADPVAPPPHNGAQWSSSKLREGLLAADLADYDATAGAAVYRRASCAKCHRFGSEGEQRAPELTRVRTRLQRKQILEAILYPSLQLNEEYPAATVLLKDGRVFTGTVSARSPTLLLLVELDGTQHRLEKADVEQVHRNNVSGMPSGLLEQFSQHEITDLFAFLLGAGTQ
jgi:putative heme-binding domain-containing protein